MAVLPFSEKMPMQPGTLRFFSSLQLVFEQNFSFFLLILPIFLSPACKDFSHPIPPHHQPGNQNEHTCTPHFRTALFVSTKYGILEFVNIHNLITQNQKGILWNLRTSEISR
jgi:hypothetical protein